MAQQVPPSRRPRNKSRTLAIVGVTIGAVLTIAFVLALVIHFVFLQTDRFNWLEAPKHSSRPSRAVVG